MIETRSIIGYRFYHIGNQWLPSVTSIIKIKPNPVLERWKSKLSEEQVRLVSEYTAERGEIIHCGALKSYETDTITQEPFDKDSLICYPQYPQMKQELLTAAQLFREFQRKYQLEPVAIEHVVWHTELGYAGRLDFAGRFIDPTTGKIIRILMDIKTSKTIYETEVSRQLSAYNYCLNNWAERLYVLLLHCGETVIDGVTIGATTPFWKFVEVKPNFEGFQNRLDYFKVVVPEFSKENTIMTSTIEEIENNSPCLFRIHYLIQGLVLHYQELILGIQTQLFWFHKNMK